MSYGFVEIFDDSLVNLFFHHLLFVHVVGVESLFHYGHRAEVDVEIVVVKRTQRQSFALVLIILGLNLGIGVGFKIIEEDVDTGYTLVQRIVYAGQTGHVLRADVVHQNGVGTVLVRVGHRVVGEVVVP